MKKLFAITLTTFTLFAGPGLVPQAEAGHGDWNFGSAFRVGDFFFRVGYHPHQYNRHGHYYVRVREPLSYRGYSCSQYCYRNTSHYYHHRSCPVVRHHFNRYGSFSLVIDRHFPRVDRHYRGGHGHSYDRGHGHSYNRGHRYGHGHSYNRGHGHGHYRSNRGHRTYRNRGHYRGHGRYRGHGNHRHTPHCGHRY